MQLKMLPIILVDNFVGRVQAVCAPFSHRAFFLPCQTSPPASTPLLSSHLAFLPPQPSKMVSGVIVLSKPKTVRLSEGTGGGEGAHTCVFVFVRLWLSEGQTRRTALLFSPMSFFLSLSLSFLLCVFGPMLVLQARV